MNNPLFSNYISFNTPNYSYYMSSIILIFY